MTAKKIRLITILIVVGVAVIIGLTGIYRVNQGEQAVVLTFGEKSDIKEAGLYWHVPMIQDVRMQSTTQQYTLEYGFETTQVATPTSQAVYKDKPEESMMLTKDQNIVSVEAVYQITVSDVSSFLYQVDDQWGSMRCAFETVLRRMLQNRTLDDALLNRQQIESDVLKDFKAILLPYNMGVTVNAVRIQNITVPAEVNAAYEDVINAMNEKTRNLDVAEKYKNEVVPNAKAQAYKMEKDAEAYSAKTIANAQGDVAEFSKVHEKYLQNKEITRTRLLIETMESILSSSRQIYMADENSGVLKMLTLNQSPAPRTETPAPTPQPTATPGGN